GTTAGTIIQGLKRSRAGRAAVRPQFEQKRLSGLTGAPHAGQNDPFGFGDVLFPLTGNIIPRGSRSNPTLPSSRGGGEGQELGLQDAGPEHAPQMGQR